MVYIIKTINGVKKKIKVAGFLTGGNPVGSMLTTFKKVNPTNYLYCDGSTFDENQYPALYLYLGTNVLPDYRECVMVGAEKNTTDIFDSTETDPSTGLPGTQSHDVFTQGQFKDDQLQGHQHGVVNSGYNGGLAQLPTWVGYDQNHDQGHIDYDDVNNPYRAGKVDAGYGTPRLGYTTRTKEKAVYYYIKAVDGVDIADEDTFLNTVVNTIQDAQSYSTTEQKTGGKWIDGKDVYRKVLTGLYWESGTWTSTSNTIFQALNADVIVSAIFFTPTRTNATVQLDKNTSNAYSLLGTGTSTAGNNGMCIIEYTKNE